MLVWLTVLALPLQGLAAAAMLHCASGAATTHEVMHQQSPHGPSAHRHDGSPAPADAPTTPLATPDDLHGTTPAAVGAGEPVAGGAHTCSACAACCAAMALPALAWDLPAPMLASVPLPASGAGSASFIASGLERPPRAALT
jgi:hypothetical protein